MTEKTRLWVLASATIFLLADASQSDFDRVIAALKAGEAAETAGGLKQAATLRTAAAALVSAGARPVEGSENLARRWQSAATRLDPAHDSIIPEYRDRALGPAYRTVTLPGGGKAVFEQVFLAGQRARVSVVSVSSNDFELTVNDDDNRRVCSKSATGDICEWVPLWTTRFSVRIVNSTKNNGIYYLVIR
jgi:hypothetical protein